MIKFVFMLFVFAVLSVTSADAAIYKGQRIFIKKCKKCHEDGQNLITKYKMREWKAMMKDKGKPLAELHLKSEKAKKSWKYFKSKRYLKDSKHLKQFLVEYAKDSGNVPACN